MLKESASKFKYYASGRRFVEGMLVTLDLRARQDVIMGYMVNMLLPQDDIVDLEVSFKLSTITCTFEPSDLKGLPHCPRWQHAKSENLR